jgi:hypothetical protein
LSNLNTKKNLCEVIILNDTQPIKFKELKLKKNDILKILLKNENDDWAIAKFKNEIGYVNKKNFKEFKKKEINLKILLLGTTGSGKTSIINFFYLLSKRFNKDKIEKLSKTKKILIKNNFFDGDEIGKSTEGELEKKGNSKTQFSKCYELKIKTKKYIFNLMLIDTPGLGDTRGIDQDEKNIENIIKFMKENKIELNCKNLAQAGFEPTSQASDSCILPRMLQRLCGTWKSVSYNPHNINPLNYCANKLYSIFFFKF